MLLIAGDLVGKRIQDQRVFVAAETTATNCANTVCCDADHCIFRACEDFTDTYTRVTKVSDVRAPLWHKVDQCAVIAVVCC